MDVEFSVRAPYIHGLTRFQVRTLASLAEGLQSKQVGARKGVRGQKSSSGKKTIGRDAVQAQLRTINRIVFGGGKVNRVKLVLWYVEHVLPHDTLPGYAEPGEKLQAWTSAAEDVRESLERSGLLNTETVALLQLIGDIRHAEKTNKELADLLSEQLGILIEPAHVKRRLSLLYRRIDGGSRTRLSVIVKLAPINAPQK